MNLKNILLAAVLFLLRVRADDPWSPESENTAATNVSANAFIRTGVVYPSIAALTTDTGTPGPAAQFGWTGAAIPPDIHGAVGPNHVVSMLNTDVRIYNRAGTTNYLTQGILNWWSAVGPHNHVFDPRIVYDPYSNR